MKNLRTFLLLLATTVLTTAVHAQILNGDLNHNGVIDVGDVTLLIDNYLTGTADTIQPGDVPSVVSITLSDSVIDLQVNESARLSVSVKSAGTDSVKVAWSSSNDSVATVVEGLVTAIREGTAIITAAVGGSKATCTVTVTRALEHEAVDMGLSVKWATMNIGASAPEEYGDYFAWGETTTKYSYWWNTYTYYQEAPSDSLPGQAMTKYCLNASDGLVDNKTVLELSDDAAHANWGGTWRMPTYEEMKELVDNCSWERTTQNGVTGYKVTASNGNSIFLPAAGFKSTRLEDAGSHGRYWSSSLGIYGSKNAWYLTSYSSGYNMNSYGTRCYGQSVRAVCP